MELVDPWIEVDSSTASGASSGEAPPRSRALLCSRDLAQANEAAEPEPTTRPDLATLTRTLNNLNNILQRMLTCMPCPPQSAAAKPARLGDPAEAVTAAEAAPEDPPDSRLGQPADRGRKRRSWEEETRASHSSAQ